MMRPRITRWVLPALIWLALLPVAAQQPPQRIAFQRNDPPAVTVMFTDGTEAVDLAPNRKFSTPYVTPALAPDGVTLVFSAMAGGQHRLFSWRLDEHNTAVGEPQRLTPETTDLSERFPSWSPDGKLLAFLATDKAHRTTLRLIAADGSGMQTLTTTAYAATPTWSPDGKQLLYIDLVDGKPVLFNIPTAGGRGIPMRPDSRIVAACYAPDGKHIAAIIEQEHGVADLYVLPPFGIGGRAILRNILGAKSISWRTPEVIAFNAARVGAQGGRAFWFVTPDGGGLQGVTGYADPKQVAYFSLEQCDLTPYVPVAVVPETPTDTTVAILPPIAEEPYQPDITDTLALHAVAIVSPGSGATVQGAVPIKMIARKDVASVSILVSGEFACTISTAGAEGPAPKVSYTWDTQAFKTVDPQRGLPSRYQESLRYPDGVYTLCAQSFDAGNKLIDQHIITVHVRNEITAGALPGQTANLQYRYAMQTPDEYFRIHAEGELLGAAPRQAEELHATLDAAIRRTLLRPLTNGRYDFRTDICGPPDRRALTFGSYQTNLPEFAITAHHALTPSGELLLEPGARNYIPLTHLATPTPAAPVQVGASWEQPMWVVADLLDREATRVEARHTLEGMEWIDGKRAIRIRSDFRVEDNLVLHTLSATTAPGLRGARTMQLARTPAPAATPGQTAPAVGAIDVWKAAGVRYSWFDLEGQRLLKVNDRILYTILKRSLPATQPGIGNDNGVAWYMVQYQYTAYTPAAKTPAKK